MRFLLLAGCIGLMTGCAATPDPQPSPVVVITSPPATLIPDNEPIRLTTAPLGGDLGGAAYQVRAYRDVLQRDRNGAYTSGYDDSTTPYAAMGRQLDRYTRADNGPKVVAVSESDSTINPAWRRYCDGGVSMTEADWAYVEAHDAPSGVPERIADDCNYPK